MLFLGISKYQELKEWYEGIKLKQIQVNAISEYVFRHRCLYNGME